MSEIACLISLIIDFWYGRGSEVGRRRLSCDSMGYQIPAIHGCRLTPHCGSITCSEPDTQFWMTAAEKSGWLLKTHTRLWNLRSAFSIAAAQSDVFGFAFWQWFHQSKPPRLARSPRSGGASNLDVNTWRTTVPIPETQQSTPAGSSSVTS